jgi:hypothetical protein
MVRDFFIGVFHYSSNYLAGIFALKPDFSFYNTRRKKVTIYGNVPKSPSVIGSL